MSAYDAKDADPKLATVTRGGVRRSYLRRWFPGCRRRDSFLCWSITHGRYQTTEGGYDPITEAVLVFAITGIRKDARRARADKEAVRDELEDAANRISDLRTRLQRSGLTVAALLDSLHRSQDSSPVDRKHPSYE
jgi:hypothetical protein